MRIPDKRDPVAQSFCPQTAVLYTAMRNQPSHDQAVYALCLPYFIQVGLFERVTFLL